MVQRKFLFLEKKNRDILAVKQGCRKKLFKTCKDKKTNLVLAILKRTICGSKMTYTVFQNGMYCARKGNGVRMRQVFIPAAPVIDSKPAYYAPHDKIL